MLETIISTGLIITLFAIATPFVFVLLILRMTTGRNMKKKEKRDRDSNSDELNNIAEGLRDLNRRVDNLETLNKNKRDKEQ